ncbi:MAG TPA: hypothetical protein VM925_13855 [Labilithrix sp.]|nr:hypothetical protein [Labilithrix sp.]
MPGDTFTLGSAVGPRSGGWGSSVEDQRGVVRALTVRRDEEGRFLLNRDAPLVQSSPPHRLRFVADDRFAQLEKTVTLNDREERVMQDIALKVLKGEVVFRLGTPGAQVLLSCQCGEPPRLVRKIVPQFPMRVAFNRPGERWFLQAFAGGHEDLEEEIGFEDGKAEKEVVVTLRPKT